ncbi:hypothetical protein CJF42_06035 [Pseudoalteromonas sp. NBT06-2]|uniref:DUF2490 domain-containing protein n=1 Tax=Pseudoalteromonas sp. NBT06-2 TaxID=2025950 RepID=UPI000BA71BDF|nr:DUF2490 domain-containing protein [Pseudoalteromonas sp. NBT06-2]PAJ75207.1 hypothetical protein CJF42_06035 [Pseudoalteromonas sp. NBT06-2]
MAKNIFISVNFNRYIIFFITFTSLSSFADDKQLWLSANNKVWQSEDKASQVTLYKEMRISKDVSDVTGFFLGPILRHKLNDYLKIGGAYKFINIRGNDGHHNNLNRWEIEFTPNFFVDNDNLYKLSLRNRLELITQSGASDKKRLRQRLMLTKKFTNNRYLKSMFVSHELINVIKYDNTQLEQYRFVPLGLKFKLTEDYNLNVFYMLKRSNKEDKNYNHILGLNLSF